MLIYVILLLGVMGLQSLYFGEPLSSLWLVKEYPPPSLEFDTFLLERDVVIGISLGWSYVALTRWTSLHFEWSRRLEEELAQLFTGLSSVNITMLAVSSSLVEEVIFRGWLLGSWGLILSSLVFGLLHLPPRLEFWPWTASAIGMGFVFGGLYLWRGSVTAPFIAHFTINYFNLHALTKKGVELERRGES